MRDAPGGRRRARCTSGSGRASFGSSSSSPVSRTSALSQMASGSRALGGGFCCCGGFGGAPGGPIEPGVMPLTLTGASQPYDDGAGFTPSAVAESWNILSSASNSLLKDATLKSVVMGRGTLHVV